MYKYFVQNSMITVPISEFRAKMPIFLAKVKRGVKVSLTSHGKVVATLTPPPQKKTELDERLENLRRGAWIGDLLSPISDKWEAQD